MKALFASYACTLVVFVVLDLVWLGIVAKPLYQGGVGHLLAKQPNVPVAVVFYCLYALGLMVFAVAPHGAAATWRGTLVAAALFGFFAYATYDLTNLATLRDWPTGLTLLDMAWGTVLSTLAAAAGKAALDAFTAN